MYLQIGIVVLCLIAGLACFAAMRDAEPVPILILARKLTGATLLLAAAYLLFASYESKMINPPMCWFIGLMALGQLLFAMYAVLDPALIARLIDHPPKSVDANHA